MIKLRKELINIIEDSAWYNFDGEGDRLVLIKTIEFLFDKYEIDGFYENYNISKKEYSKYFKKTIKKYNPKFHAYAEKHYKEKKDEIKRIDARK